MPGPENPPYCVRHWLLALIVLLPNVPYLLAALALTGPIWPIVGTASAILSITLSIWLIGRWVAFRLRHRH